ncbi:MAG: hypothetical protein H6713_00790 [Myxococcales bacterium]|nr:hypothetical protein [Myxococcales bacterium]
MFTEVLDRLTPTLWAASLFRCPALLAAIGLPALREAFRLPDDPRWDPRELRVVGMTDLGAVAVSATGVTLGPPEALAPPGGLSLGSLARREPALAELEGTGVDGLILARAPGGASTIALARLDGDLARVELHLPRAPASASVELLGAIGARALETAPTRDAGSDAPADGPVTMRVEVSLARHLARTVRELSRRTDPGACNAFFLFGGRSPKAVGAMLHSLERARAAHRDRLAAQERRGRSPAPVGGGRGPRGARGRGRRRAPPLRVAGALAGLVRALDDTVTCPFRHDENAAVDARVIQDALALPLDRSPRRSPPRDVVAPARTSLVDALERAADQLTPRLVPAAARAELRALAERIPSRPGPDPIALELRFGSGGPGPVDLLACWTWSGGGLARPLALRDAPAPLERLPSLWEERGGAAPISRLDQLWLEFDAGGGGRPTPAVFFAARERSGRPADRLLPLAATVAARLCASLGEDPFHAACEAARRRAGGVHVPNIGLMFPRPRSPLRLIVAPGVGEDRSTVEGWLGDDASGRALRAIWRRLAGRFNLALPALDLGAAGPLPTRGLELQIDRGPLRRSAIAWREPLAALRDEGLIDEDEARAFGGCFLQRRVPGGGWLTIFPAYVKLAVDAAGRLRAKGYVSIQRGGWPIYELGA